MFDPGEASWEWHGPGWEDLDGVMHYRSVRQHVPGKVNRIFSVGDVVVLNCGEDSRDQNAWIAQVVDMLDQDASDSDLEESAYGSMGIIVRWFFHKDDIADTSRDRYLPKDAGLKKDEYLFSDMVETTENNTVDAIVGRAHTFQSEAEIKRFRDSFVNPTSRTDETVYNSDWDEIVLCRWFYGLNALKVENPPRIRKLLPKELSDLLSEPTYDPMFYSVPAPSPRKQAGGSSPKTSRSAAAATAAAPPPPAPADIAASGAGVASPGVPASSSRKKSTSSPPKRLQSPVAAAAPAEMPESKKSTASKAVASALKPTSGDAMHTSAASKALPKKRKASPSQLADPSIPDKRPKTDAPRTSVREGKRTIAPESKMSPKDPSPRTILGAEKYSAWLRSMDGALREMGVAAASHVLPQMWRTLLNRLKSRTGGKNELDRAKLLDPSYVEDLKQGTILDYEATLGPESDHAMESDGRAVKAVVRSNDQSSDKSNHDSVGVAAT
jgi:hypothetical protein